jgi:hypothetical protein
LPAGKPTKEKLHPVGKLQYEGRCAICGATPRSKQFLKHRRKGRPVPDCDHIIAKHAATPSVILQMYDIGRKRVPLRETTSLGANQSHYHRFALLLYRSLSLSLWLNKYLTAAAAIARIQFAWLSGVQRCIVGAAGLRFYTCWFVRRHVTDILFFIVLIILIVIIVLISITLLMATQQRFQLIFSLSFSFHLFSMPFRFSVVSRAGLSIGITFIVFPALSCLV